MDVDRIVKELKHKELNVDFVKLLIPSKWTRPTMDIYCIIKEIVKEAIEEKVKVEIATLDKFIS